MTVVLALEEMSVLIESVFLSWAVSGRPRSAPQGLSRKKSSDIGQLGGRSGLPGCASLELVCDHGTTVIAEVIMCQSKRCPAAGITRSGRPARRECNRSLCASLDVVINVTSKHGHQLLDVWSVHTTVELFRCRRPVVVNFLPSVGDHRHALTEGAGSRSATAV